MNTELQQMQSSIFLAIRSFKAINSLKSDTLCLCFQAFLLEKTLLFFFPENVFPCFACTWTAGQPKTNTGWGGVRAVL